MGANSNVSRSYRGKLVGEEGFLPPTPPTSLRGLKEKCNFTLLNTQKSGASWQKQPLEVFCKKRFFEKFANFTGKHLCCNFIKKKLWCFPVKLVKFLRTPTLKNICKRLLLSWASTTFPHHLLTQFSDWN